MTEPTFDDAASVVAQAAAYHERRAREIYVGLRRGELTQTSEAGRECNAHQCKASALRGALEKLDAMRGKP